MPSFGNVCCMSQTEKSWYNNCNTKEEIANDIDFFHENDITNGGKWLKQRWWILLYRVFQYIFNHAISEASGFKKSQEWHPAFCSNKWSIIETFWNFFIILSIFLKLFKDFELLQWFKILETFPNKWIRWILIIITDLN